MAEIRIGRAKIYVEYVGEGRYTIETIDKGHSRSQVEMSKEQLATLGRSLQVMAKGEKVSK